MKKNLKYILPSLVVFLGLASIMALLVDSTVLAADLNDACNQFSTGSGVCSDRGDDAKTMTKNITRSVLALLGILAVITIIIGGVKYVTAQGDSGNIATAKHTIVYAVIGLVVVLMAQAIVGFVVDAIL